MEVELREGRWQAVTTPQPTLWRSEDLPDYYRHIGRNTDYVIHPEETLADNFAHLIFQTTDLPDPWIVDRLGRLVGTPRDRTTPSESNK
jgi:hypothetical protein